MKKTIAKAVLAGYVATIGAAIVHYNSWETVISLAILALAVIVFFVCVEILADK